MNLINRDDAIAIAKYSKDPVEGIKHLPAVDAVEVVRCKDCQEMIEKGWCSLHQTPMVVNDFCSYGGERKE